MDHNYYYNPYLVIERQDPNPEKLYSKELTLHSILEQSIIANERNENIESNKKPTEFERLTIFGDHMNRSILARNEFLNSIQAMTKKDSTELSKTQIHPIDEDELMHEVEEEFSAKDTTFKIEDLLSPDAFYLTQTRLPAVLFDPLDSLPEITDDDLRREASEKLKKQQPQSVIPDKKPEVEVADKCIQTDFPPPLPVKPISATSPTSSYGKTFNFKKPTTSSSEAIDVDEEDVDEKGAQIKKFGTFVSAKNYDPNGINRPAQQPTSANAMSNYNNPRKRPYNQMKSCATAHDGFDPTCALIKAGALGNTDVDADSDNSLTSPPKKKKTFVSPLLKDENKQTSSTSSTSNSTPNQNAPAASRKKDSKKDDDSNVTANDEEMQLHFPDGIIPERILKLERKLVLNILNEIVEKNVKITWDDIAGLEFAKESVQEAVILPLLRPDLFKGIRAPHKGLLLYGPPGTGKTLIGKAIATESNATFFSISASSLMSKWIGEGEKLVKTLFEVARCFQPSVIFVDEIDSLLTKRSESDSDSGTRRMKNEFLVQLDGARVDTDEERILIVGATNRPQELDNAALRRMAKRLFIPLPNMKARRQIIERSVRNVTNTLDYNEIEEICKMSEGYSGSDLVAVVKEASMEPVREIRASKDFNIMTCSVDSVRPIAFKDFGHAFEIIKPSVSHKDIKEQEEWGLQFGTKG